MEESKVPEINIKFKVIKVEPREIKLDWYALNRNGTCLLTKSWFVYMFYKVWWKIRPPKMIGYIDPSVLEYYANKEIVLKQLEKIGDGDAIL